MTDHLPECLRYDYPTESANEPCICPALRACEARMEARNQGFADMASFELGKREERKRSAALIADAYAAGVQAARDAVEALEPVVRGIGMKADALAAIDALKGESNG